MAEETVVTILKNGPVRVQGRFTVKDSDGNDFDLTGRDAVSLCRCGQSGNKPFCDGSHKGAGFQSEVKAR